MIETEVQIMYERMKISIFCFIMLVALSMLFFASCSERSLSDVEREMPDTEEKIQEESKNIQYQDVKEIIKPKGDPREELLEFCRYLGLSTSELKGLFGEIILVRESGDGMGRIIEMELMPRLFFNFGFEGYQEHEVHADYMPSVSFDAEIGFICPSITEMTPKQFSDIFEATMRIEQAEADYEYVDVNQGDFTFNCYFYIDPQLITKKYGYINAEYWADKVAIQLFANLGDNPQYIKPDTVFSIMPVRVDSLPPSDYWDE